VSWERSENRGERCRSQAHIIIRETRRRVEPIYDNKMGEGGRVVEPEQGGVKKHLPGSIMTAITFGNSPKAGKGRPWFSCGGMRVERGKSWIVKD